VVGGAEDDHEGTRVEDAVERIRQGMKVMLRFGSAWHDVAEGVRAITELGLDSRRFVLCTDDCHSGTLVMEGHVNRAVKQAIAHGIPPITAIQMVTINTAEHFGVSRQVGLLAPGRFADILLVDNLVELSISAVFSKGKLAAQEGQLLLESPAYPYPAWVKNSVHLARPLQADDFRLPVPDSGSAAVQVQANVIGVIENQAPTQHLRIPVAVWNGEVHPDLAADVAKIALVERHTASGKVQIGLVHGFGFTEPCAIASTVAHDSHQLLVVGTNEDDMAIAVNALAEVGGGQVVVLRGEVIGLVELPIAGLMSNERAETVARKAAAVLEGFQRCGCKLNNPNMQLSLLALVVIPELRISDLGLVDVTQFKFIPVLESN
jgi:adenine deaminase